MAAFYKMSEDDRQQVGDPFYRAIERQLEPDFKFKGSPPSGLSKTRIDQVLGGRGATQKRRRKSG